MSPDDPSGERGSGEVPVDGDAVVPERSSWQWDPPTASVPAEDSWATTQVPPRRRRRRAFVLALVATVAAGALGTGIAVVIEQQKEHQRQDRLAAERRAATAYVKSVRPLVIRVFDAVQPAQDALDSYRQLRPGLEDARFDVFAHGGAVAELGSIKTALKTKTPPAALQKTADAMSTSIVRLQRAIQKMTNSLRVRQKGGCDCKAYAAAWDEMAAAQGAWDAAVTELKAQPAPPMPAANRVFAAGRATPTRGSFIYNSDLACAVGEHKLVLLPEREGADEVRNFPASAKILRSTIAALRKVKAPASSSAARHRLDVELQSVTAFATTMDELYSAWKKHSYSAYRAALALWDEELKAFEALHDTYETEGVSICATLFAIPEDKASKEKLSA